jgi:mRNA interferase RelE/StbE
LAYAIEIVRSAQKQLIELPKKAQSEVVDTIDHLVKTPRPIGCKKLRGTDLWRIRTGRYRIVYSIDDTRKQITILKVALRNENTYRQL